jgi:hypothetical protein
MSRPTITPGQPRPHRRATAPARPHGRNPRQAAPPHRIRRADTRAYRQGAQRQLRRFRQGSAIAVALTALLLMVLGGPLELDGQGTLPPVTESVEALPVDAAAAVDEATGTIRELAFSFYAFLPRLVLALVLFAAASLITHTVRWLLDRMLREWERREAVNALTRLMVYLAAAIAAVSVLAGDVRAAIGSVGLLGLAASWALQTPIESFTGWLLNSFRGYYRVGDRIAVGDVFGDVYRIDVLTTTVWEAGGSGKPVSAAQSTGALITFPNWEVLRSNVVNLSRDFPFVWDEVTLSVANESDLPYTASVLEKTARRVLGGQMEEAAHRYEDLLRARRLMFDVDEVPRVYLSFAEAWINCTIRYLVPVRSRRGWSSTLSLEIAREVARPEHRERIISAYPRTEVKLWEDWPKPAPPPPGASG